MHTATTTTDRLLLSPPTPDDAAELHALHADPRVWGHLPSGRHTSTAQTERLIDRYAAGWREHGLDVWVARRRTDATLVGMGGCSLRHDAVWNLYYRLAPEAWGQGYTQEIIRAALSAVGQVAPELPVVAYLLEHNASSRAAAERAGLGLVWRGPDAGNPDPSAVRLVYADRELDPATLGLLTQA